MVGKYKNLCIEIYGLLFFIFILLNIKCILCEQHHNFGTWSRVIYAHMMGHEMASTIPNLKSASIEV